ncbi:hypothetical protein C8R45DRAFT_1185126 [Mycena sanguinolenta]|nr:hypothetical protein C8R45DRAFT_1185126 [Mycena sanguinolenta]
MLCAERKQSINDSRPRTKTTARNRCDDAVVRSTLAIAQTHTLTPHAASVYTPHARSHSSSRVAPGPPLPRLAAPAPQRLHHVTASTNASHNDFPGGRRYPGSKAEDVLAVQQGSEGGTQLFVKRTASASTTRVGWMLMNSRIQTKHTLRYVVWVRLGWGKQMVAGIQRTQHPQNASHFDFAYASWSWRTLRLPAASISGRRLLAFRGETLCISTLEGDEEEIVRMLREALSSSHVRMMSGFIERRGEIHGQLRPDCPLVFSPSRRGHFLSAPLPFTRSGLTRQVPLSPSSPSSRSLAGHGPLSTSSNAAIETCSWSLDCASTVTARLCWCNRGQDDAVVHAQQDEANALDIFPPWDEGGWDVGRDESDRVAAGLVDDATFVVGIPHQPARQRVTLRRSKNGSSRTIRETTHGYQVPKPQAHSPRPRCGSADADGVVGSQFAGGIPKSEGAPEGDGARCGRKDAGYARNVLVWDMTAASEASGRTTGLTRRPREYVNFRSDGVGRTSSKVDSYENAIAGDAQQLSALLLHPSQKPPSEHGPPHEPPGTTLNDRHEGVGEDSSAVQRVPKLSKNAIRSLGEQEYCIKPEEMIVQSNTSGSATRKSTASTTSVEEKSRTKVRDKSRLTGPLSLRRYSEHRPTR